MKFVKVKNINGTIGYVNLDNINFIGLFEKEVKLCFSEKEYDSISITLEEFEVNVKGELK